MRGRWVMDALYIKVATFLDTVLSAQCNCSASEQLKNITEVNCTVIFNRGPIIFGDTAKQAKINKLETNQPTPCRIFVLGNVAVPHLAKKFYVFLWNQKFIHYSQRQDLILNHLSHSPRPTIPRPIYKISVIIPSIPRSPTENRGHMVNNHASYSGNPGFKSRLS
jgi:hypothetical protein